MDTAIEDSLNKWRRARELDPVNPNLPTSVEPVGKKWVFHYKSGRTCEISCLSEASGLLDAVTDGVYGV